METTAPNPAYKDLIELRRNELDTRLREIFPSPTGFVCEIGSGHGHFLTAYANGHRDLVCVGVDLIGERVERANRKRERAKLSHLHFIHAEARLFLETLPAEARIAKVFILFPDPWPKKRHHKHRILQPSFLSLLRLRSTPEVRLFFRTDYQPYFDDARSVVEAHPDWQLGEDAWPFEYETVFQQRAESYRSLVARPRVSS